jgi:hypothetical protein
MDNVSPLSVLKNWSGEDDDSDAQESVVDTGAGAGAGAELAQDAIGQELTIEPLLNPSANRFLLEPIRYPDLYAMYELQQASMWPISDINLGQVISLTTLFQQAHTK